MTRTEVGMFGSAGEARIIVVELVRIGVNRVDIGVMAPIHDASSADLLTDNSSGSLGGQAGLVVKVPGFGLMLATGPIQEVLRNRKVLEGMLDTLTEIGVPEAQVFFYADGLRRGGTLLSVVTVWRMSSQISTVMNGPGSTPLADRLAWARDETEGCDPCPPDEARDTLVDGDIVAASR